MQPQNQAVESRPANEYIQAGHGVVIADDDKAAFPGMCGYLLEPIGLPCTEATYGEQALRLAGEGGYDLVLLDVDLPGHWSTEVLRRLRENPPSPHLKVIIMSGLAGEVIPLAERIVALADV